MVGCFGELETVPPSSSDLLLSKAVVEISRVYSCAPPDLDDPLLFCWSHSGLLPQWSQQPSCKALSGYFCSARISVAGFGHSAASKAAWDIRNNTLTTAAGQIIIKVKRTDTKSPTQRYHPEGQQKSQHGEHAHDYLYDADGNLRGRPSRELTETERKENSDIL